MSREFCLCISGGIASVISFCNSVPHGKDGQRIGMDTTNNIHMDIREGRIYIGIGNMEGRKGTEFVCGSFFAVFCLEWVESCIIRTKTNHTKGENGGISTNRETHT